MGRVTKAEKNFRIQKVLELLLAGYLRQEIFQIVTNPVIMEGRPWEISIHMVDKYIKEANVAIKSQADINMVMELGKAKGRLEKLFQKTLATKEYRDALAVQKEINEVLGLKEQRVRVTGEIKSENKLIVEIVKTNGGNGGPPGPDNGGPGDGDGAKGVEPKPDANTSP